MESNAFEKLKSNITVSLESYINEYEKFINKVSSKNWRTTGSHITELRKMIDDIKRFEEISENELKIDWIREQLK